MLVTKITMYISAYDNNPTIVIYKQNNSGLYTVLCDTVKYVQDNIYKSEDKVSIILPMGIEITSDHISWDNTLTTQLSDYLNNDNQQSDINKTLNNVILGIRRLPSYFYWNIHPNNIHIVTRGGDGQYVLFLDNMNYLISNIDSREDAISYLINKKLQTSPLH